MVEIVPRYISSEEFARFIDAKEINANCLRCGATSWHLHDTADGLGMAGLLNGTDGHPSGRQTHLVTLSCGNCGTLWSLVRGAVQEWLDENPNPEAKD